MEAKRKDNTSVLLKGATKPMPSMRNSYIELDPKQYRRDPIMHRPEPPIHINPAPEPPIVTHRSPVLISSMPAISTNVDGISRQFYAKNLPTRRLTMPT